jgi:hypothetical protein
MERPINGVFVEYFPLKRRSCQLFQRNPGDVVDFDDLTSPLFAKRTLIFPRSHALRGNERLHLNPLRAGLVKNTAELDRYRWCGHAAVTGKIKNEWQDLDYVLRFFGKKPGKANGIVADM